MGRQDVFDAKRDDDLPLADGSFDLAPDLRRVIGLGGEDQQNDLGAGKRIDDGFLVLYAGEDIPGRNPAGDALRLKRGARCIRNPLIVRCVADEYCMCHSYGPTVSCSLWEQETEYTQFPCPNVTG